MTVTTKRNGQVNVEICCTHYGHKHELQHIRISKIKRREMAMKIREGISRECVLDEIRESVAEDLHHHHLMDKKGFRQYHNSIRIREHSPSWKWSTKRSGMDRRVEGKWKSNPILYYKLQDEDASDGTTLAKEDFFIAVQTQQQKHMFQQFASKGVCCDTTHGTNGYDFSLATILVADEFGKGFPAGWCISNHEDFAVMHLFFSLIRKNCGIQHSGFFMSNMAPRF
jgi:hypothetical protein